jgi:hypothetical protein
MIECREVADTDIVEVVVEGRITADEYHAVAEKMLTIMNKHKKLRVLKEVHNFSGIDLSIFKEKLLSAMLTHWKDIVAAAVVTDEKWVEQLTNFLKPVYPYPVRCFKLGQIEEARQWLNSIA